jgi:sodium-dependent dicarboxylate transporter 2/3/5
MSTLVGTAPNIIFVGFIQETYGIEISFVDWMKLGVPLAILMLGASWYAITKIVYPVHFIASIETKLQLQNMLTDLGPLGRDEKKVLIIFSLAASAWMFRTLLDNFVPLSWPYGCRDCYICSIEFFLYSF